MVKDVITGFFLLFEGLIGVGDTIEVGSYTGVVESIIPWPVWRELFVGQYGLVTLGLTYTFAIILPIVSTFFTSVPSMKKLGVPTTPSWRPRSLTHFNPSIMD